MPAREPAGNRYDAAEWAGAFGDVGTLLPFVIAYLGILKLDAAGVLFGFGVSMIVSGWIRKTPFPVQPMKAAGAVPMCHGAGGMAGHVAFGARTGGSVRSSPASGTPAGR
ncbi:MAG TPA: putative sulfate/molybdate transporter [Rubrivivax sp.]|nr:putative sulfate/molybdate transporter [Rubrivivax sp.]